jgi:hypothetical protein
VSNDLKNTIKTATNDLIEIQDEMGVEVFYDFAITPAIRLIPSYQKIWNPLLAQVETRETGADVFMLRLSVNW